jgi:hypothetical protein
MTDDPTHQIKQAIEDYIQYLRQLADTNQPIDLYEYVYEYTQNGGNPSCQSLYLI